MKNNLLLKNPIQALIATEMGQILELPGFEMMGRSGDLYRKPFAEELSPFPENALENFLPNRVPMLWSSEKGPQPIEKSARETYFPTAAILPVGYLRTLLPAAAPSKRNFLPQWAYTAIGISNGERVCACIKIESSDRWENHYFNTPELQLKIEKRLSQNPQNRVLKQLALCASEYHCNTAQNIFYGRWEGALPASPVCNAQCVGCISLQPEELPPSSHERINFAPTVEEILNVALPHLEESPDPILSFGQGCEGEPLMAAATLEKAILAIRAKTLQGTLNLNTNASYPLGFLKLCKAGLETVRISMNSAIKETYESYYQPKGYGFEQVIETAKIARDHPLAVSINLLTFPGVTDREEEAEALLKFIKDTQIAAIQWRNLAIDPDQYLQALPPRKGQILGIPPLLNLIKSEHPQVHHLSFSRPKEFFRGRAMM
ncbi:MAG: radical SAM protein [Chlamydiae bacterium]|nr:radical SAM protein [Chlamydiota bacterium]MBI3266064.1 radical SAM protein [Chlamydiota bacterium]